jgi:hypothetical protein
MSAAVPVRWRLSSIVCAMADHPIDDYCIITFLRVGHPERWSWEIHRKSKPLGVRLTQNGFQSEIAASFAGKRALADFLDALSKEEKRPRR